MTPTPYFRHVFRHVNDGNGEHKVLALQQWNQCEGWEHEDYVKAGGMWEDVPFVTIEDTLPPPELRP